MRYLLPNFIDFIESVTGVTTKHSERHVSAYKATTTTDNVTSHVRHYRYVHIMCWVSVVRLK